MLNCVKGAAAAVFLLYGSGVASAQEGTAVAVRAQTEHSRGEQTVTLIRGADIRVGDIIETNRNGEAQLEFADGTRIVVGRFSTLIIEDILFRQDNRAQRFIVNSVGGTYRFISGNSPSRAYEIRTPTATLGVRGTIIDWTVDRETGETDVVVLEGEAITCAVGDVCEVTQRDDCGVATSDGLAVITTEGVRDTAQKVRDGLPYVVDDRGLEQDFRANLDECGRVRQVVQQIIEEETPEDNSGDDGLTEIPFE